MSREIIREIVIKKNVETVFDSLIKPSLIKAWWGASSAIVIPEPRGFYAMTWGDDEDEPDYITISKIVNINRPNSMELLYENYKSKSGALPFESAMCVYFQVEKKENQSLLKVKQTGFPDDTIADDYYQGCVTGWEHTLAEIKKVLETG